MNRAFTLPLLIPLTSLLIISFHLLTSPALAAGGEAPSFQWPAQGAVTCPFRGSQDHYGAGGHAGIDIGLSEGTSVCSAAAGRVTFAGRTPLGLCVSVAHDGGFKSTYVSLETISVRSGESVGAGAGLGSSDGSTDRSSSAPHLHFGISLNGVPIDPLPLLQGLILDPQESLFLGPWEDKKSLETYLQRHNSGNIFTWLGGGFKAIAVGIAGACAETGTAIGRGASAAWRATCKGAGWVGAKLGKPLGRFFQAFYRSGLKPWLEPACRAVAAAAKKAWSNRYVQALVAGLLAAAIVVLAVVGLALLIGASIVATVIAAAIGAVAAIGYAFYYAATSGASFSFAGCFLSSLAVGGAAGIGCLLLSFMAPLISTGWASIGFLGFAKGFLIHGVVDSLVYIVFCLSTGRKVSPMGLLATFLIGGLSGGFGKLFTSGFFSEGALQGIAAAWLSSGGVMVSESISGLSTYAMTFAARFLEKAAYMVFCGCGGFLGDLIIRACMGGRPSVLESVLSFGTGMVMGGVSLVAQGQGITGFITRLTAGRLKVTSDLLKAIVGKGFSWSLKDGLPGLVRRLRRSERTLRSNLWWSDIGGDL